VISGTTVEQMPLNGRNPESLSLLLPGVVSPNPSTFSEIRNFGGGRPYVNGNREQTNNYMIDGVDMNESIDNLVAYQPSPTQSPRSASRRTTTPPIPATWPVRSSAT
jgi:hypothetical protein